MRILHVINIFFSTSYLGDQFKYFSEKGYKQYLICSPSENLREYSQRQKIEYTEMMIMRKISLFNDLLSVFKICKYISKNKIQIVVGHTPKGALLAMMSGYLMNVPKRIYFRHGLVYETMTGFSRKLMITIDRITAYLATQIVCVSPSLAEKSIQDGLNSPKKQLVLGFGTCSGIDAVKKFNPQNVNYENLNRIRNSLGFQSEDFVVGYCGRLVVDKGIVNLVNGFNILKSQMPFQKLKLLLVGDFEERDKLPIDIVEEIRSNQDIIYTGFIYDSIENYYALMNVFILPSYREGFGIVSLEAASMEIIVLTTNVTGCKDAIQEGETGFFITNDPYGIALGIKNVIENPNVREIGKNGRKMVLDKFENNIVWPLIEHELYLKR